MQNILKLIMIAAILAITQSCTRHVHIHDAPTESVEDADEED